MALNDGYGVLVGTISDYFRDPPDNFGRYFHGNLRVTAGTATYRCAIDVDSHQSAVGVEWRVLRIGMAEVAGLVGLGPGLHPLASTPTSGALDYVRSPMLRDRVGCLLLLRALLRLAGGVAATWKRGTSLQALTDLEPLVMTTRAAGLTALVFGEPFRDRTGMHNIHQNQGDPPGSPWAAENGIWQDGCTLLQQDAATFAVFMNKFTSQAYVTDDAGRPA
jgi:hypothetical protein